MQAKAFLNIFVHFSGSNAWILIKRIKRQDVFRWRYALYCHSSSLHTSAVKIVIWDTTSLMFSHQIQHKINKTFFLHSFGETDKGFQSFLLLWWKSSILSCCLTEGKTCVLLYFSYTSCQISVKTGKTTFVLFVHQNLLKMIKNHFLLFQRFYCKTCNNL